MDMSTGPQVEPTNFQPPTWEAIREAHARIASRIHRTPVLASHSLDAMGRAQFFFKCDNFQKTGSFKIRGAANAILSLTDAEAAHGIVTPSSGNHGAAVACAAAWRGVPAYIVMPKNAPAVKCRAVESYGGRITFSEPTITSRQETSARVQAETGAILIHPYDNDRITATTRPRNFSKKSRPRCRARTGQRWGTAQRDLPVASGMKICADFDVIFRMWPGNFRRVCVTADRSEHGIEAPV